MKKSKKNYSNALVRLVAALVFVLTMIYCHSIFSAEWTWLDGVLSLFAVLLTMTGIAHWPTDKNPELEPKDL